MRLIDADALIQSLEKKHAHWHELVTEENKEIEFAHSYALNVIRNAPTVESHGDLISRADAIEAIQTAYCKPCKERGDDHNEVVCRACNFDDAMCQIDALPSAEAVSREEYDQLEALYDAIRIYAPSAEAPTGELILRADAIELLTEIVFDEPPYFDSETLCRLYAEEQINTLPSAEIAETEPIVIRSKTLMPTKDFREWAKRIRETNPNAVVIPCDAEVVSAEAVQGWIPCSERLPDVDVDVLTTTDWSEVLIAWLKKGGVWEPDEYVLDHDEIIAWMPLPKPYKGGDTDDV